MKRFKRYVENQILTTQKTNHYFFAKDRGVFKIVSKRLLKNMKSKIISKLVNENVF